MTVKPYPSNTIILNIAEEVIDRNIKLALDRSWTYVGSTVVRTHPTPEGEEPSNFIHIFVKFGTRHYLASGDAESDANWSERMKKHIESTLYKVCNNTKIFNRTQRNANEPEVAYDFVEIELESGALTLQWRLDSNSDLPESCASMATQVRELMNAGALGDGVVRVAAPSAASYEAQLEAFLATKAEREAEAAAAEEAARKAEEEARTAAEEAAEERFLESPELTDERDEELEAEALEMPAMTEEEWEAAYAFDSPDFEIDYSTWDVSYSDGSTRAFDSSAGAFVA